MSDTSVGSGCVVDGGGGDGGERSQMLVVGVVSVVWTSALSMSAKTVDVPLKLRCSPSLLSSCLWIVPLTRQDGCPT